MVGIADVQLIMPKSASKSAGHVWLNKTSIFVPGNMILRAYVNPPFERTSSQAGEAIVALKVRIKSPVRYSRMSRATSINIIIQRI